MAMARGVMGRHTVSWVEIVPCPARRQASPGLRLRRNNGLHSVNSGRSNVEDLTEQIKSVSDEGTVGRLVEPVIAAFPPGQTIGQTVEALREMVKTAFITYIYVVDNAERLLGIVTMRDLLFGERDKALDKVMLRDVFALQAAMPLADAMRQVLDEHYPAYPVVDADGRLRGPVAGPTRFE